MSNLNFRAAPNNADVHCVSPKSFSARLFSPLMAKSLIRKGTQQKGFLATPIGALRPALSLRYNFLPYVSITKKLCLDLKLDVKPVSNCIVQRCPDIMSHVSIGTNNYSKAIEFYDKVLATVGAKRVLESPENAIGYGREYPEFWVQEPYDKQVATVGNGVHFAFLASNRAEVNDFYRVAIEFGATDDGKPGPRPHYGEPYYGCYVRDLDGNKIEAMYWDLELAAKLGL